MRACHKRRWESGTRKLRKGGLIEPLPPVVFFVWQRRRVRNKFASRYAAPSAASMFDTLPIMNSHGTCRGTGGVPRHFWRDAPFFFLLDVLLARFSSCELLIRFRKAPPRGQYLAAFSLPPLVVLTSLAGRANIRVTLLHALP